MSDAYAPDSDYGAGCGRQAPYMPLYKCFHALSFGVLKRVRLLQHDKGLSLFPESQIPAIVRRMSDDDTDNFRSAMRAVVCAIAEETPGLNLSQDTIADLQTAARGEIDIRKAPPRIHQRLRNGLPASVR